MSKFRKKPVVIDALLWTGRNVGELTKWAAQADFTHRARAVPPIIDVTLPLDVVSLGDGAFNLLIKTPEGEMLANHGDWIICGVKGEFYPCKPDIFEATYEAL